MRLPQGVKIGNKRLNIPSLVLILSVIFIIVGFSTGFFEEKQIGVTPNGVELFTREARASLGLKEEDITVGGGKLCEVVEPVYAQLKCVVGNQDLVFKISETVDSLGPRINNPKEYMTLVDFTIPEWSVNPEIHICGVPKLKSNSGKAWRFDWKSFNDFYSYDEIKKLTCVDCDNRLGIIYETENGDFGWYYGPASLLWYNSGLATYVSSAVVKPPQNTKYIYVFLLNLEDSWSVGSNCYPWGTIVIEPTDPGDWALEVQATSKYLEYSVPGSEGPYRLAGSFGCEAPDVIAMLRKTTDASATGSGPLNLYAGVVDDAAKSAITKSRNIGGGTYVLGVESGSALDSSRTTDSTNKVLVSGEGLLEGEAVTWLQLYRNTNIKYDTSVASAIVPKTFNGQSVICDQARSRLLDFQELPLTDYQKQFGLCYAIPGNVILDMSNNPDYFFSCSESYCRQFGTPAGKPVYDPANYRCVGQDTPVATTQCVADTQCEPQLPITVRTDQGAIKFTGDCQNGKCVVKEDVLECKPGDQTAVSLCTSQGEWIDLPSTVSNCPTNSCCSGDPRFFDQSCPTGTQCCMTSGATTGNCQQTCIDVVADIEKPTIIDGIGDRIQDSLGLGTGESKFLTLIILAIIVVVVFILILAYIGRGKYSY